MKRLARVGMFLLLALCVLTSAVNAQVSRSLSGGTMGYTSNEAFTGDGLSWPRGVRNFDTSMLSSFGVDVAVKMAWTDAAGINHDVKVAEAADNRFTDMTNVVMPVPDAFKRVFRNQHPAKIIDKTDWQDVNSKTDPVDGNIPSDEMLYHHCTTWVGVDIERWTYAFETKELGDIVFIEWLFTNTDGVNKDDVYLALRAEPGTSSHYPGDLWGNYVGADFRNGGDDVRLYYNIDANEPGDGDRDDRSDPASLYGNFEKPQFMSYALIHADTSPADETNDIMAPVKGGWSQRQLSPDLSSNSIEEVYEFFGNPWDPINPDLNLWPGTGGLIRAWPADFDLRTLDSGTEQEKTALFSFGPFQMNAGDDVRIIMAMVGGAINGRVAIDAGYAYDWGADGLRDRKAYPNDEFAHLGVAAGSMLTMDQKDAILNTGLDSLMANARMAIDIWENSSVNKGTGSFNVTLAPPSPSLEVTSNPGFIQLDWGTEADGANIAGFRVYRNLIRPPSVDTPTDTSYILIAEVPGTSTHEYVDENVTRGQAYYYYVTAYDNSGVESSQFLNRGNTGTLEEGASPTRSPDENWQDNVVVVPNPYHVRSANKFSGDRLVFFNTPAYCNIHIYTMSGDLVQTLQHSEGTGDEAWLRQDTFSTMRVVSGIYLYVVEELDGPYGNATGETAIGKFIVVR